MKNKFTVFALLLLFISNMSFGQTPANNAVGVSITPDFAFTAVVVGPTTHLQVSTASDFSVLVIDKNLANGDVAYTFSSGDLINALVGKPGLENSTIYYWRIYNTTGSLWVQPAVAPPYSFTTASSAMPYLSNPSNGAELSGQTTTFSWYSGVAGVKYFLQIAKNVSFTTAVSGPAINVNLGSTTNTYFTISNSMFSPGTTYYWRIITKSLNETVVYNYSSTWQFSMPALPQPIVLSPSGNGTIYLNPPMLYWYSLSYNPKVSQYIVRYRRSDKAYSATITLTPDEEKGTFSTIFSDNYTSIPAALTPGAKYFWQVASSLDETVTSLSDWSVEESFSVYGDATFLVCYPSYPASGASVYSNKPTLYWYSNLYSPVIYFKVRYATSIANLSNGSAIVSSDLTTSSYTIPSALTSGTYYWQVKGSIDAINFGAWSAAASFTVPSFTTASNITTPIPTSPNGGIVTNVTNPTLIWAAYSDEPLQFKVSWATNPSVNSNGTFNSSLGTSGWISANTFVLSGLQAGATYYWQVQARLATTLVEGSWSTIAWFTTSAGSASVVPIAGSPINGSPINNTSATLSWVLPTQSSSLLKFDVQISRKADFSSGVTTLANIEKANANVSNLEKNAVYYWRVASKTDKGDISNYSTPTTFNTGANITGVEKTESLPVEFELSQNYPNPFNPTTIINYALPKNSFVTLKVYDMLGREVKTLVNNVVVAGKHSVEWRGDDYSGSRVATGVYVYRVTTENFVSSKKMLLIK